MNSLWHSASIGGPGAADMVQKPVEGLTWLRDRLYLANHVVIGWLFDIVWALDCSAFRMLIGPAAWRNPRYPRWTCLELRYVPMVWTEDVNETGHDVTTVEFGIHFLGHYHAAWKLITPTKTSVFYRASDGITTRMELRFSLGYHETRQLILSIGRRITDIYVHITYELNDGAWETGRYYLPFVGEGHLLDSDGYCSYGPLCCSVHINQRRFYTEEWRCYDISRY